MLFISAGVFVFSIFLMILSLAWANKAEKSGDKDKKRYETFSSKCNIIAAICFAVTFAIPIIYPHYAVWQQSKEGEAELAKAEQNRQIAIQEAKAKEESAMSLANAEVIRAQGIAQANKIIGDSLQNNDAYIHYLWIEALRESQNDVIYIPTEAGIPITESARFFKREK